MVSTVGIRKMPDWHWTYKIITKAVLFYEI